jgi:hypothetical protein
MKLFVLDTPLTGEIFDARDPAIFDCADDQTLVQAGCRCSLCKSVQHV